MTPDVTTRAREMLSQLIERIHGDGGGLVNPFIIKDRLKAIATALGAERERTGAPESPGETPGHAGALDNTLDAWQDRVAALWPFDQSNYPMLRWGGALAADALQHIALHQAKDAGKIAAAVEPADHGRPIDYGLLERATRNALVNALRLCTLIGASSSGLLENYTAEVSGAARSETAPAAPQACDTEGHARDADAS